MKISFSDSWLLKEAIHNIKAMKDKEACAIILMQMAIKVACEATNKKNQGTNCENTCKNCILSNGICTQMSRQIKDIEAVKERKYNNANNE